MSRLLPFTLLSLVLMASWSVKCVAQNAVNRYYPRRPTISPYMNYFLGANPGDLDRYNAYVRPAQQLQQTVGNQESRIRQLGGDLRQLRQTSAGPTGIGGVFGNFSHFYPNQSTNPSRR